MVYHIIKPSYTIPFLNREHKLKVDLVTRNINKVKSYIKECEENKLIKYERHYKILEVE
jgi:hypothetical protein